MKTSHALRYNQLAVLCSLTMVDDFLLAFAVSTLSYGAAVALAFAWMKDQGGYMGWQKRFVALNKALDVANFANAVIASVLSSWALYQLEERFLVRGGRASGDGFLADCVLGSVCGYIAVEILVVSLTSARYSNTPAWSYLWHIYGEMVLFHAVAFVGLTSVVLRNTGYPVALWVVWSELTTVFIGLENFTSGCGNSFSRHLSEFWGKCASLLFIVQRVVLFYYLLWQSWISFVWETGFVFQLGVLLAGTLINTHMGWKFITN